MALTPKRKATVLPLVLKFSYFHESGISGYFGSFSGHFWAFSGCTRGCLGLRFGLGPGLVDTGGKFRTCLHIMCLQYLSSRCSIEEITDGRYESGKIARGDFQPLLVFHCSSVHLWKGSSPVHEDGIACCKDAHKDKCNNLPSRERVSGDPFGKFCVQSYQSNMKICQTDIGTGCAI